MQVSLPSAGRLTALPAALLLVVAMAAPMAAQSEQSESVGILDGTWTVDPIIGSFDYAADDRRNYRWKVDGRIFPGQAE